MPVFIPLDSLKSVHFKKPVVVVILKMTTLFERNEDRVTGFLK